LKTAGACDDELEEALLTRNSTLINLGLARYSWNAKVVRRLFATGADNDENTWPVLRLAALSNQRLPNIPHVLFGIEFRTSEPLRRFVTEATDDEVLALFTNPKIDSRFLGDLYAHEGVFDGLDESRWRTLIAASTRNPRLKTPHSTRDGWEGYDVVFDQAWSLTARVSVTEEWAQVLSDLLEGILGGSFSLFSLKDRVAVIDRWRVPDTSPRGQFSHEIGYLDIFGYVRFLLGGLWFEPELCKESDDVALRCAYYRHGELGTEDLRAAFAREPKYFLNYGLDNHSLWADPQARQLLERLCTGDLDRYGDFRTARDRFKEEHPKWFMAEEEEKPDPFEKLGNQVQELRRALDDAVARNEKILGILFAIMVVIGTLLLLSFYRR
jgi:hypothetical protein